MRDLIRVITTMFLLTLCVACMKDDKLQENQIRAMDSCLGIIPHQRFIAFPYRSQITSSRMELCDDSANCQSTGSQAKVTLNDDSYFSMELPVYCDWVSEPAFCDINAPNSDSVILKLGGRWDFSRGREYYYKSSPCDLPCYSIGRVRMETTASLIIAESNIDIYPITVDRPFVDLVIYGNGSIVCTSKSNFEDLNTIHKTYTVTYNIGLINSRYLEIEFVTSI